MVDLTQLLLLSIIIILTLLLVVIGTQVFFLIRDVRKTIKRIDAIAQEATEVSSRVKNTLNTILDLKLGVGALSKIKAAFFDKKEDNG